MCIYNVLEMEAHIVEFRSAGLFRGAESHDRPKFNLISSTYSSAFSNCLKQ